MPRRPCQLSALFCSFFIRSHCYSVTDISLHINSATAEIPRYRCMQTSRGRRIMSVKHKIAAANELTTNRAANG